MIGAPFNGLPTAPLLQPDGVRFDPVKMLWLGSTNRETQVTYLWHTAPVKTFADILKTEVVTGAQAAGTTQWDYPLVANAVLNYQVQGRHRLQEHAGHPSRDGTRRDPRQWLDQLDDAAVAQRRAG